MRPSVATSVACKPEWFKSALTLKFKEGLAAGQVSGCTLTTRQGGLITF